MTPISALAILFCIYAVSELIAQKTKAIFSTVLSIAILLLAGFWSDILPRTLIDDAQITGFGNIIAGLLIGPCVLNLVQTSRSGVGSGR